MMQLEKKNGAEMINSGLCSVTKILIIIELGKIKKGGVGWGAGAAKVYFR